MRTCGGCTICCKIARVPEISKPSHTWCKHCAVGKGCTIYDKRPDVCSDFRCLWLNSDAPEDERPDQLGFFVSLEGEVAKVNVDIARPDAWKEGLGHKVVEELRERGHVIVQVGNQVTFLQAKNRPALERLILDWTL